MAGDHAIPLDPMEEAIRGKFVKTLLDAIKSGQVVKVH
jgi:hypothetical protein